MDKFYIIANSEKDEGLKVSERVAKYLEGKGKSCAIRPASFGNRAPFTHYTDIRAIPDDVECVIVLGGDGTLLQAARDVVHREIVKSLFWVSIWELWVILQRLIKSPLSLRLII